MKYCVLVKNDAESLQIKQELINLIKHEYDEDNPQVIVCVGGDGTILSAIHKYANMIDSITIFGIHTGSLGFFTNYQKTESRFVSEIINDNNFMTEEYPLLSYKIKSKEKTYQGFALNEITIVNPYRTLVLEVLIDDEPLESFRGTGLCVSTPYGSTAYNKSLHGAVVDPTINSMQLTEIASINSNAYRTLGSSLVLSDKRLITLKTVSDTDVWVTADNENIEIQSLEELSVFSDKKTIKMAMSNNQTFFKRVKKAFINKM